MLIIIIIIIKKYYKKRKNVKELKKLISIIKYVKI